jgi:hypothetical protein
MHRRQHLDVASAKAIAGRQARGDDIGEELGRGRGLIGREEEAVATVAPEAGHLARQDPLGITRNPEPAPWRKRWVSLVTGHRSARSRSANTSPAPTLGS